MTDTDNRQSPSSKGRIVSANFVEELRALLNRHSVENASDTPDFVLAEYLMDCLGVWETAVSRRDKWYGFSAHGDVVMDLTNPSSYPSGSDAK